MYLVGDVGGTKCILALYEINADGTKVCQKQQLFASTNYPTFTQLLNEFLVDSNIAISAVCIGVAGPIEDGDCNATNLPWVLKRDEIAQTTGTKSVWLLNDLEAAAWGILALPDSDFVDLNPKSVTTKKGNIAIIAAGTGLGEAIIVSDDENHKVIATEGGHADFAPTDPQQIGLLQYLLQTYPDHASYERLLSGGGLLNIYNYLKASGFTEPNPALEQQMQKDDPAAVIGKVGVASEDKLCVEAVKLFCRIYGAEAGNLALKCLPKAGVYLVGGIAGKILTILQSGEFLQHFLNKGRMKTVLEHLPIRVCLNQEVALSGALHFIENKCLNAN